MKKLFVTLLLSATTISSWAYDIKVNDIYYNLDTLNRRAEVTNYDDDSQSLEVSYTGNIVIPDSIKASDGTVYVVSGIGEASFGFCEEVTSVVLPKTIKYIGDAAFWGCCGLTSIVIPKSVTTLGDECFHECSGLDTLQVDPENTVFDSRNNCNAIIETKTNTLVEGCNKTVIPDDITAIGSYAFVGRTRLESIAIPGTVTSIGDDAFANCKALTTVVIPKSVSSIGKEAYLGCETLSSLSVEEGNTVYDSRNNCNAIIVTASDSLISTCLSTEIPNTVKIIGDNVFSNSKFTSFTIPESVTKIGSCAFSECNNLTTITIGNSVEEIGNVAFGYCSSLEYIVLGRSVKKIGGMAFATYSKLKTVVCYAEEVPAMGESVFLFTDLSDATLKVPAGSVELYKAADQWKDFGNIVAIETAGIDELRNTEQETKIPQIYNLSGQKAKATDRGVMIIGGKKVLK